MKKKKNRKLLHNNDTSTWSNTAKEQPYLMPGTSTYEEYQEDLQMHDPFRPDDDWHEKQEIKNEDHSQILMEKAEEQKYPPVVKLKATREIAKMSQFKEVKRDAIEIAKETEDEKDDSIAEHMRLKDLDNVVYNDGVTVDEFLPKALSKYM